MNLQHACLSALQSVSIFFSLGAQVLIAQRIGPGPELDSYFAVIGFAMTFVGSIGIGGTYLLPARIRAEGKTKYHQSTIAGNGVVAIAAAGVMMAIVSIIIFSSYKANAQQSYVSDYDKLLVSLGWFGAFASVLATAWAAVGNAYGRVLGSMALGIVPPATMSLYMFGAASHSVEGLAGAQLTGICLQTIGLACIYRTLLNFSELNLRVIVKFAGRLPLAVAGGLCFSAYSAIDALLAPELGAGVLSHQALAQRLVIAFCSILSAGPFMLAPSITATMLDEGLKQDAWKYTFKAAKVLIVVCLFTSACTLWIGQWAIGLLFQWGVFGTSDTQAVTIMLTILLIGAGPMLASAVAFRVLQNTGNSLHIAYLSFTWVILYALFAKLFNVRFGNLSLSIAYVVTWSLIALAAYILLARNLKSAD